MVNSKSDGTVISSFDYTYDNVGNRTRVVEADGVRVTWAYDNAYQLIREQRSDPNAASYNNTSTYDGAGNRLTLRADSPALTTYTYDAANQNTKYVDSDGTTINYIFDAAGNPIAGDWLSLTWTWDAENRMLTDGLTFFGATRTTHTYDGDGRRIKMEIPGNPAIKYLWDGENVLVETDNSNVPQVLYTLEPAQYGLLLSRRVSGATHLYLFDGLGSTDRFIDVSNNELGRYVYTAFGGVTFGGISLNTFQWLGRFGYYCNSNVSPQYYVRARHFDSTLFGRWMNRDPIGFRGGDANLYRYVGNQVLTFSDPSGLTDNFNGIPISRRGTMLPGPVITSGAAAAGIIGYCLNRPRGPKPTGDPCYDGYTIGQSNCNQIYGICISKSGFWHNITHGYTRAGWKQYCDNEKQRCDMNNLNIYVQCMSAGTP